MDTSSVCSTDALESICSPLRRVSDSVDHKLDCCEAQDLPDLAQCPGVSARRSPEDCSRLQSQEVEDFEQLAVPLPVASLRTLSSTDETLVHRQLQLSEPGTYMGLAPPYQLDSVQEAFGIGSGLTPEALISAEQLHVGLVSSNALGCRGIAAVLGGVTAAGAFPAVVGASEGVSASIAEIPAAEEHLSAQTPPSPRYFPPSAHMAHEAVQVHANTGSSASNWGQPVPQMQSVAESSSLSGSDIAGTSSWLPGHTQVGFITEQQLPTSSITQQFVEPMLPTVKRNAATGQPPRRVPATVTAQAHSKQPVTLLPLQHVQQQAQEQQGAPILPAVQPLLRYRTSSNASSIGDSATSTPRASSRGNNTTHLVSPGLQARIRAAELAAAGRVDPISWAAAEAEAIQADTEAAAAAARRAQQQHLQQELQKRKAEAARVAVQLTEAKGHFSAGGAASAACEVAAAAQPHLQQHAQQENRTQLLHLHRKSVPGRLTMPDYSSSSSNTVSTDARLSSCARVEPLRAAPDAATTAAAAGIAGAQAADAVETESTAVIAGVSASIIASLPPPELLLQDNSLVAASSLPQGSRGSSPQPGRFPNRPVLGQNGIGSIARSSREGQPLDSDAAAAGHAAGAAAVEHHAVSQLLQPSAGSGQLHHQQQQHLPQRSASGPSSPKGDHKPIATSKASPAATAAATTEAADQASSLKQEQPSTAALEGNSSSARAAGTALKAGPSAAAVATAVSKRAQALSLMRQQQQRRQQKKRQDYSPQSGSSSPSAAAASKGCTAIASSNSSESASLKSPTPGLRIATTLRVSPKQSPSSPAATAKRPAGTGVVSPQQSPKSPASGTSSVTRGSGCSSPQCSPSSATTRLTNGTRARVLSPQQSPKSPASGTPCASPGKPAASTARPPWNSNTTRLQPTRSSSSSPKAGGSCGSPLSKSGSLTSAVRSPLTSPPLSPSSSRLTIGTAAPSRIARLAGSSSSSNNLDSAASSSFSGHQPQLGRQLQAPQLLVVQAQPSQRLAAAHHLPQQHYNSGNSTPAPAAGTAAAPAAVQAVALQASDAAASPVSDTAAPAAEHMPGVTGTGEAAAVAEAMVGLKASVASRSPLLGVDDIQRFHVLDFTAVTSNTTEGFSADGSYSGELPEPGLTPEVDAQEVCGVGNGTFTSDSASIALEQSPDTALASDLQHPQVHDSPAAVGCLDPQAADFGADVAPYWPRAEPAEFEEADSPRAFVAQSWPQSHQLITSSFGGDTAASCLTTGQQAVHTSSDSSIAGLLRSHQLLTGSFGVDTTASCLVTGQPTGQGSSSGTASEQQSNQRLTNSSSGAAAETSLLPYGLAVVMEGSTSRTDADAVGPGPQSHMLMSTTFSLNATPGCSLTGQLAAADAGGAVDDSASSAGGNSCSQLDESMQGSILQSHKLLTGSFSTGGTTSTSLNGAAADAARTFDTRSADHTENVQNERAAADTSASAIRVASAEAYSSCESGPAATTVVLERTAAMLQHHYLRNLGDGDCLLTPPDLVVDRLSPRSSGTGCIAAAALSRTTSHADSAAHSQNSSTAGSPGAGGCRSPAAHSRNSSFGGAGQGCQLRLRSSGTGSIGCSAYNQSGSVGGSQLRNVSRHTSAIGFGQPVSSTHVAVEASAAAAVPDVGGIPPDAVSATSNSTDSGFGQPVSLSHSVEEVSAVATVPDAGAAPPDATSAADSEFVQLASPILSAEDAPAAAAVPDAGAVPSDATSAAGLGFAQAASPSHSAAAAADAGAAAGGGGPSGAGAAAYDAAAAASEAAAAALGAGTDAAEAVATVTGLVTSGPAVDFQEQRYAGSLSAEAVLAQQQFEQQQPQQLTTEAPAAAASCAGAAASEVGAAASEAGAAASDTDTSATGPAITSSTAETVQEQQHTGSPSSQQQSQQLKEGSSGSPADAPEADTSATDSGASSTALEVQEQQNADRSSTTAALAQQLKQQQSQQLTAGAPDVQEFPAPVISSDTSKPADVILPLAADNSGSGNSNGNINDTAAIGGSSNPNHHTVACSTSGNTTSVSDPPHDNNIDFNTLQALPAPAADTFTDESNERDDNVHGASGGSADLSNTVLLDAVPQKLVSRHSSTQSLGSDHAQHEETCPLSEQPTNSPPHFMMSSSLSCSPCQTADTTQATAAELSTAAVAAARGDAVSNEEHAESVMIDPTSGVGSTDESMVVAHGLLQQIAPAAVDLQQQQQQLGPAANIHRPDQQQQQQRGSADSVSGHLKLQQLIPQKPKPRQQQMPARILTWGGDAAPAAAAAAAAGPSDQPGPADAALPAVSPPSAAAAATTSSSIQRSSSGSPPAPVSAAISNGGDTSSQCVALGSSLPVAIGRSGSGQCRNSSSSNISGHSSGGSSAVDLAAGPDRHLGGSAMAALIADDKQITSSFKRALLESICSREEGTGEQQQQEEEEGGRHAGSSSKEPTWQQQQQQQISNVVAFVFPRTSSSPAFGNRNSLAPSISGHSYGSPSTPRPQQQQRRPAQVLHGSGSHHSKDSHDAAANCASLKTGSYHRRRSAGEGSSDTGHPTAGGGVGDAILTAAPMLRLSHSSSSSNIQPSAPLLPEQQATNLGTKSSQLGTAAVSSPGSIWRPTKDLSLPLISPTSEGTKMSEGTDVSVTRNVTSACISSSGDGSSGVLQQQQQQQQQDGSSSAASKRQQGLLSAQIRRSSSSSSGAVSAVTPPTPPTAAAAATDRTSILALPASPPSSAAAAASDAVGLEEDPAPVEGRVRGKNSAAAALLELGTGAAASHYAAGLDPSVQGDHHQQQQQQQTPEHKKQEQKGYKQQPKSTGSDVLKPTVKDDHHHQQQQQQQQQTPEQNEHEQQAQPAGSDITASSPSADWPKVDQQQQQQQQPDEQQQQTPRSRYRVSWADNDDSPCCSNSNLSNPSAASSAAATPCGGGLPPVGPSKGSFKRKAGLIRASKSCMEFSSLVAPPAAGAAAGGVLHQQQQQPGRTWPSPGAAAAASSSGLGSPRQQQQQQQQVNVFTEAYAVKGALHGISSSPAAAAAASAVLGGSSMQQYAAPANNQSLGSAVAVPAVGESADYQQQQQQQHVLQDVAHEANAHPPSQAISVPAGRLPKPNTSGSSSRSAPAEISLLSCSWHEIEPLLDQDGDQPHLRQQNNHPAAYSFQGDFYRTTSSSSRDRSSNFTSRCLSSRQQQQQQQKERVEVLDAAGDAGGTVSPWQLQGQTSQQQPSADTVQQQVAAAAAAAVQQGMKPLLSSTEQLPQQQQRSYHQQPGADTVQQQVAAAAAAAVAAATRQDTRLFTPSIAHLPQQQQQQRATVKVLNAIGDGTVSPRQLQVQQQPIQQPSADIVQQQVAAAAAAAVAAAVQQGARSLNSSPRQFSPQQQQQQQQPSQQQPSAEIVQQQVAAAAAAAVSAATHQESSSLNLSAEQSPQQQQQRPRQQRPNADRLQQQVAAAAAAAVAAATQQETRPRNHSIAHLPQQQRQRQQREKVTGRDAAATAGAAGGMVSPRQQPNSDVVQQQVAAAAAAAVSAAIQQETKPHNPSTARLPQQQQQQPSQQQPGADIVQQQVAAAAAAVNAAIQQDTRPLNPSTEQLPQQQQQPHAKRRSSWFGFLWHHGQEAPSDLQQQQQQPVMIDDTLDLSNMMLMGQLNIHDSALALQTAVHRLESQTGGGIEQSPY